MGKMRYSAGDAKAASCHWHLAKKDFFRAMERCGILDRSVHFDIFLVFESILDVLPLAEASACKLLQILPVSTEFLMFFWLGREEQRQTNPHHSDTSIFFGSKRSARLRVSGWRLETRLVKASRAGGQKGLGVQVLIGWDDIRVVSQLLKIKE